MFESARLTYRELRTSDLDALHALWNDAGVQRGLSAGYPAPKADGFRATLAQWGNETLLFAVVVDTATGAVVGQTSLRWGGPGSVKNRDAELGMAVARAWWGTGVGTEVLRWTLRHAFRAMGLHRVSLTVLEGNTAAVKLYERAGFVHEGSRRKANWVDGEWEAAVNMGMLEEEYFEKEKKKATAGDV